MCSVKSTNKPSWIKAIYYLRLLLIIFGSHYSLLFAQQPEWKKKYTDPRVLQELFAQPPAFYAPHVFWFWDDTLRNEQFPAAMAAEMTKQRLNPGYAHPRSSMNDARYPALPPAQYLAKPWFNSFQNALDRITGSGFTLGYCDDYDWPSGQAAGKVLQQRPDLRAQYLDWKRVVLAGASTVHMDSVDFAVAGRLVNGKLDAHTLHIVGERAVHWTAPDGAWVLYTYRKKYHAGYDGGQVNYLHPDLMKTFIPLVHDRYDAVFGDRMGKHIPGIFVDHEGDYGWQMAWSDYVAEQYKQKRNRDIRLWLPMLTEKDRDGLYVKARNEWFDAVSQAYVDCFFKPLVDWADRRDMYVISNLWEETLQNQTMAVGDLMRSTRAVSMPGNDCLVMKSQQVHDFKEVQSVAELEDRPFMSEIMGVAGWEQTPQMMKMSINAVTSFGVSHVVPHGINLNRKLETIPFPADWYTENPFWPYLHLWSDFSRRASFVVRQTQLVADVLLFHPLESIWGEAEGMFHYPENTPYEDNPAFWSETSKHINRVYSEAMEQMNRNNIDFLIADAHYLAASSVQPNSDKAELLIRNHRFKALVLPPLTVLSQATSKHILAFAEAGGTVVLLGDLPTGSPEVGKDDPYIVASMNKLRNLPQVVNLNGQGKVAEQLADVLNGAIGRQMQFSQTGRLYTTHRQLDDTHFYWLANNTDTLQQFDAWFREGRGAAELWNCETGEVVPLQVAEENGGKKIALSLQPYEGYWVVFNPLSSPRPAPVALKVVQTQPLADTWTIRYVDVDTIFRTSGIAWHHMDADIERTITAAAAHAPSGSRSSFIRGSFEKTAVQQGVMQEQQMDLQDGSRSGWQLLVPLGTREVIFPKAMRGLTVWLDGRKATVSDAPLRVPPTVKKLSFVIDRLAQLPTHPLAFVVQKATKSKLATWYGYGLDQYTGSLDYEQTIDVKNPESNTILDLGKVDYMAEVFVNGQSVGARLWPPYRFAVGTALRKGKNTITVRVGNLMVNRMALKDDLQQLRTWSWGFSPAPKLSDYDSGIHGPVHLEVLR